jgi:hypothetical protein
VINRRPEQIHNHQVIAHAVERISIAPCESSSRVGDGQTVFIEHVVSKFLQASYNGSV